MRFSLGKTWCVRAMRVALRLAVKKVTEKHTQMQWYNLLKMSTSSIPLTEPGGSTAGTSISAGSSAGKPSWESREQKSR